MIKMTFPDGNTKEFPQGTTGEDIAQSISPGLKKQALGIKLNDEIYDLTRPIEIDGTIAILTYRDAEGIDIMRHSAAHTMAQAIKRLYKDVQYGVGTTIEDGFYYDIDMDKSIKKQALGIKLNDEMYDLTRPIEIDGTIAILTYRDAEGIDIMRHSAAHTMAQAIKRLYKDVQFGVGPTIEDGFYYDIDMDKSL